MSNVFQQMAALKRSVAVARKAEAVARKAEAAALEEVAASAKTVKVLTAMITNKESSPNLNVDNGEDSALSAAGMHKESESFAAPGPSASTTAQAPPPDVFNSPAMPGTVSEQSERTRCIFCKPNHPCQESFWGIYTTKSRLRGSPLRIFHWALPGANVKSREFTVAQGAQKELTKQINEKFRQLTFSREPVTMQPRLPGEPNLCTAEEYTRMYNSCANDEARITTLESLVMPPLEQRKLETEVLALYTILSNERTIQDFEIVDANHARLAQTANAHQSFALHCVDAIKLVNERQMASTGAITGSMRAD